MRCDLPRPCRRALHAMEAQVSLLDEIRSDLVNESAGLANTLRKAKILASAIGLPEFQEWVDSELGGYTDRDRVPAYRRFRPTNLGTFAGPFNSMVKNMVLPTYNLPDEVREFAENMIFFDGVGALEAQKSSGGQIKWSQEMILLARDEITISNGMILVDAHQPVPAYLIPGILDQIKNKLLDFILGLQESNVTSEDLDNRTVPTDTARNLFYINIYGDRNIVASGEHVTQQPDQVIAGDIDSLLLFLHELDIEGSDLSELQEALLSEPDGADGHYGPRVRAWLGKMISRAASETWDIGVEAASKVLTAAINHYYGLS